jgi:hypothetical protein
MERNDLSRERQLVLLSSIEVGPSSEKEFTGLVTGNPDWGKVVYQHITHRTLNMFCYNLEKYGLEEVPGKEITRLLYSQKKVYEMRNAFYFDVIKKVMDQLHAYGVIAPVLKGNYLAHDIYPRSYIRYFNDLDLLIDIKDTDKITKALTDLGYIQGHYDKAEGRVVEATRKEKMLQQIASHELQEFQKMTDNPFVPLVQVDVNHDILWKGNCPYHIASRDLVERAVILDWDGVKVPVLSPGDNIIQLCCHLYKEATLMMWISDLRDLTIYKFADLYLYITKAGDDIDWKVLTTRIKGYGIEKVIYYCFYYLHMMFGGIVPGHVMAEIEPENRDFLDEYAIENKTPSKWKYDFFTRLFDTNRVLSLEENQDTGMKEFIKAKTDSGGVMHHHTLQQD